MEMIIDFPQDLRVDAHFGPFHVKTNQDGTDPAPFGLFLASIGTCAGIYVLAFCQNRGISAENVRIVQRMYSNPMTGLVSKVDLEIQVPEDFPQKYYKALIRSADQCAVKKHFENPPQFDITTKVVD